MCTSSLPGRAAHSVSGLLLTEAWATAPVKSRIRVKPRHNLLLGSAIHHDRRWYHSLRLRVRPSRERRQRWGEGQVGLPQLAFAPPFHGGLGEPPVPQRGLGEAPRFLCCNALRLSLTRMRDLRERRPSTRRAWPSVSQPASAFPVCLREETQRAGTLRLPQQVLKRIFSHG